jgi:hypothetical protein
VLEIALQIYTGHSKAEIDIVFAKLNDNYGVAGPIYIQYVLDNLPAVQDALFRMQAKIDKELELNQLDRYYSCALACSFVGAKIAQSLGLHDIDIKRVYRAAVEFTQQARIATREEVGDLLLVAQETLAAFINENVNNALVINRPAKGGIPSAPIQSPKGQLKMRYEPDTKELIVTVAEFRKHFSGRQVDVKESLMRMARAGIVKNDGRSSTVRIGAGAIGSLSGLAVRCYIFDGEAIGIDQTVFSTPTP